MYQYQSRCRKKCRLSYRNLCSCQYRLYRSLGRSWGRLLWRSWRCKKRRQSHKRHTIASRLCQSTNLQVVHQSMLGVLSELTVAGSSSTLEDDDLQSTPGMTYSKELRWYCACGGAHAGGHGQTRSQQALRPRQEQWQISFFQILLFQVCQLRNMYDVRSNSREIGVNECPRKEWRGGGEQ